MTCEQLRKYTNEIEQRQTAAFWSEMGVAAHVARCADCGEFVREQQRLREGLLLLRASAGTVSESLDAAVVANYRRYLAEGVAVPRMRARSKRPPLLLRWSAATAFALVVIAVALFLSRKQTPKASAPIQLPPRAAVESSSSRTAEPQIQSTKAASSPMRNHRASYRRDSEMRAVAPIPDDFRGLMYCDELSCDGAMDMIRVQLPSSVVARPGSAFTSGGGPVYAEVLVGPDGIARGIRIEE